VILTEDYRGYAGGVYSLSTPCSSYGHIHGQVIEQFPVGMRSF